MKRTVFFILAIGLLLTFTACSLFFSDFKDGKNNKEGNLVINLAGSDRAFGAGPVPPLEEAVFYIWHYGADEAAMELTFTDEPPYVMELQTGNYSLEMRARTGENYFLEKVYGYYENLSIVKDQRTEVTITLQIDSENKYRYPLSLMNSENICTVYSYDTASKGKSVQGSKVNLEDTDWYFLPYGTVDRYGRYYRSSEDGKVRRFNHSGVSENSASVIIKTLDGEDPDCFVSPDTELFYYQDPDTGEEKIFVIYGYSSEGGGNPGRFDQLGWIDGKGNLTTLYCPYYLDYLYQVAVSKKGGITYLYLTGYNDGWTALFQFILTENGTLEEIPDNEPISIGDIMYAVLGENYYGTEWGYNAWFTDMTATDDYVYLLLNYDGYTGIGDDPSFSTGVLVEIPREAFLWEKRYEGFDELIKCSSHCAEESDLEAVLTGNNAYRTNKTCLYAGDEYIGARFLGNGSMYNKNNGYLYILDSGLANYQLITDGNVFLRPSVGFSRVMKIRIPFGTDNKLFEGPDYIYNFNLAY